MSAAVTRLVARALPPLLLVAVFGALVAFAAAKVAHFGLCCADDGYFASTAKNLAMGAGYGVTVYGDGFQPFHPQISVGPPVILPAALGTFLLGNRYWVPGAVAIGLWALLLVLAYLGLRGRPEVRNLPLAASVFLGGVVLLFPFHFELWFTLLGEVPAALFLLLAAIVLGRGELAPRGVALASFVCALGFQTKTISAIFCAAFFLALAVRVLLLHGWSARELLRHAVVAGAAFLAPILAFELYKLVSLGGLRAYRENVSSTLEFIRDQGAPPALAEERWARALAYDRAFAERVGVTVLQLAGATLAAGAALLWLRAPLQRRVALPVVVGVLLSCVWFLFFSIGWPRYLLLTLVLAWALVALVLTALRGSVAVVLGAALLLALYAVNHEKLPLVASGVRGGAFVKSPGLSNALALTELIDARAGTAPFAHQWWATTSDLEYYARGVDVFRRYTLVDRGAEHFVVFNRSFRYGADDAFDRLVAGCAPEGSFEPYVLLRCRP